MCIFCDIIDNKIPSKKIYEDDDILAILDISQATKGHALVIPKKHFDNITEVDKDTLSKLTSIAQDLAIQITNRLNAKGFNLLVNTNEAAGQTVKHMHLHILPRYEDDNLTMIFKENDYDLDELLKQIKPQ